MKTALLVAACLAATGCVTNYTRLRLVSSPPGAHVDLPVTGEYLGTAPAQPIVSHRFFLLKPRQAVLQVRFRIGDGRTDVVRVRITEGWKSTREKAERSTMFASVLGFVAECRCTRDTVPVPLR